MWSIQREAAWVNVRREAASVMLMVFMMSGIAAALIVIPPQLPIDDTVTITPYGHYDYNRILPGDRGVNIEVVMLEGVTVGSHEFLWFSVLDFDNYTLKTAGSPYFPLFRHEAYSGTVISWWVPSDGSYFFVLENPSAFSVRASIKIVWVLEWLPLLYAVIALSVAAVTFAIVRNIMYVEGYAPQRVELRGDLLMVPDVVKHAPERIDYIVIIGPDMRKCIKCKKDIPIASEKCEYCGVRQTGEE